MKIFILRRTLSIGLITLAITIMMFSNDTLASFLAVLASLLLGLYFFKLDSKMPTSEIIKLVLDLRQRKNLRDALNRHPEQLNSRNEDLANKLVSYGLSIDDGEVKLMCNIRWLEEIKILEDKIRRGEKVTYLVDPEKAALYAQEQTQLKESLAEILGQKE